MIRREIEHDRQRVRPREAAGTAGQAGRRRGPAQGRGGHRDRNEGAQGPLRRRPARHPGGHRRGHRPRRRRGPAAGPQGRSTSLKLEGDEAAGVQVAHERPRDALPDDRRERRPGRLRRRQQHPARARTRTSATTPTPATYGDLRKAGVVDPGQGDAQRPAERRQRRLPAADHRIVRRRHPRREEGRTTTTTTIMAWAAWVGWAVWEAWVAWAGWVAWAA